MYVITGLGRSGTSFIAEIFHNLGYDMGIYNPQIDAGYEHAQIVAHNSRIMTAYPAPIIDADLQACAKEMVIAKDPRFMLALQAWVRAEADIEGVFLCQRDYQDIVESTRKSHAGLMDLFVWMDESKLLDFMQMLESQFILLCIQNKIPIYRMYFPWTIEDFRMVTPLNIIIRDENKLKEIWEQTRRKK